MSNEMTSQLDQLAAMAADDVFPVVDVSDKTFSAFGTNKWISRQDALGITGTPMQVFNVMDYGAVGDGVTDDSTAFQNCQNALEAAGTGIFFAPAGTYKLASGITITPMNLDGLEQVYLYGAILNYTGNGSGLTIATNIDAGDVQHAERSVHVFGLHMKGTASASCALRLKATNCTFYNTVFEDFTAVTAGKAALIMQALFHFWVEQNQFHGLEIKNTGNGIYLRSDDASGGSSASLGNNYFNDINIWVTQNAGKGVYGDGGGAPPWANASRCVWNGVIVHPVNATNVTAFDFSTTYSEGMVLISPSIDIFGTCTNLTGFNYTDTNATLTIISPTCFPLAGITNFFTGGGHLVVLAGNAPSTLLVDQLGNVTVPTINKLSITAPANAATLTIANNKTLTVSNTLTFTGTDGSSVAFGAGGTVAYRGDNLGVFAATTSAQLAGVISDETGSGALVFGTNPTLSITGGVGSLTLVGQTALTLQDSTDTTKQAQFIMSTIGTGTTKTFTFPNTSGTLAVLGAQTFSGIQTISVSDAVTAAVTNLLVITHNSSGTPAANFGVGIPFNLKSSTTNGQAAGALNVVWSDATHASRTAFMQFQLVFNAAAIAEVARLTLGSAVAGFQIGVAGTSLGQLTLAGNTSGTTILQPAAAASGTLTLPAATDQLVGRATTDTLTNKRVTPRINSTASSATPAINTDTTDQFNITALAAAITSMTTNLTGTPTDGQQLMVRIKDNGTARAITWGASFASSGVATLLSTTVINKTHHVLLRYDSATAKWICLAVDTAGY